jgi:hypothetical protein
MTNTMHGKLQIFLLILALACNPVKSNNNKNGIDSRLGYEWIKNWPKLPAGYKLSQATGVGIDTGQNIFLFHRAGREWTEPFPDSMISSNTILMLDNATGIIFKCLGRQ